MPITYTVKEVPKSQNVMAREIHSLAFVDSGRAPDRQLLFLGEQLSLSLGCYAGDELVGLTGVIDFEMRFGDRWIPCAGIAGVACLPSHRRRGVVKQLLTECLKILNERRVPIASLWPFSYPFYKKMGWEVTDFQTEIDTAISSLPANGDASSYKAVPLDSFAAAMPAHDRWSENMNLSLRRSAKRWQWMLERPNKLYSLFVHEDGYMLWDLDAGARQQRLVVAEWGFSSQRAMVDGLALLSTMDSQFTSVNWRCEDAEPFLKLINCQPPPVVRMLHGMMSRIVHVDAFREALPVKSAGLTIVDPLGVSGPPTGKGAGPGQIVQHVTGLWKQPDHNLPDALHAVIHGGPAFSIEQY
jgi:predicted acetyltransferase